jgi:hypothetical protein
MDQDVGGNLAHDPAHRERGGGEHLVGFRWVAP